MEEGEGVRKFSEERIDPEFQAKVDPNFPMGILGLGSFRGDTIDDGLLDSEEVIAEDISELR